MHSDHFTTVKSPCQKQTITPNKLYIQSMTGLRMVLQLLQPVHQMPQTSIHPEGYRAFNPFLSCSQTIKFTDATEDKRTKKINPGAIIKNNFLKCVFGVQFGNSMPLNTLLHLASLYSCASTNNVLNNNYSIYLSC